MHKYHSPQDPNYIRVLSQLKDMIEKAPSRVKARLNRRIFQFISQNFTDYEQAAQPLIIGKKGDTESSLDSL